MKRSNSTFAYVMPLLVLGLFLTQQLWAQGYDTPLTFQGLSRTTNPSAVSRSAGGIMFGLQRDASFMFTHPASLMSVKGLQFSVGGLQRSGYMKQDQRYSGIQGSSAFAPLMEGTTGSISDPDTNAFYNGTKVTVRTQADSVQRPFDSIGQLEQVEIEKRAGAIFRGCSVFPWRHLHGWRRWRCGVCQPGLVLPEQ
jgi:hypothetical protein